MKQFTYTDVKGHTFGPYGRESILRMDQSIVPWVTLNTLGIGGSFTDDQGDTWLRCYDEGTEPVPPQRERLERIATPVFAAMINASPMLSDAVLARTAVDFAKALIAEMDKQS